jgi:hypothetical protein
MRGSECRHAETSCQRCRPNHKTLLGIIRGEVLAVATPTRPVGAAVDPGIMRPADGVAGECAGPCHIRSSRRPSASSRARADCLDIDCALILG